MSNCVNENVPNHLYFFKFLPISYNFASFMTAKLRELEKLVRILKQEKDEFQKDKLDMQEKLKLQDKELKDALAQRKLAMTEYAEVSDKLSELRQQKQKLSRQVRDKEEELERVMQKVDSLRNDIRRYVFFII